MVTVVVIEFSVMRCQPLRRALVFISQGVLWVESEKLKMKWLKISLSS